MAATICDASYEETLMNHFAHFRNHGLHNQLLVACLDAACQEQCLNASIYHVTGLPQNVPETKLRVILEVLVAHYQLLFFDADVFFLKHPLTGIGLVENIDLEVARPQSHIFFDQRSCDMAVRVVKPFSTYEELAVCISSVQADQQLLLRGPLTCRATFAAKYTRCV